MFLTRIELHDLIGTERPATARRWLDGQHIPYLVGIDGWPRVLRSEILHRLGSKESAKPTPQLRLAR